MVTAQPVAATIRIAVVTVPVGTELDVRLQTPLNSGTAKVEQRFEATTILDLTDRRTASSIPAGIGRARVRQLGPPRGEARSHAAA